MLAHAIRAVEHETGNLTYRSGVADLWIHAMLHSAAERQSDSRHLGYIAALEPGCGPLVLPRTKSASS